MFEGIPDPPSVFSWIAKAGLFTAGAAGLSALAVPAARNLWFPEIKDVRLRDHILFDRILEDGRTVRATDGTLCLVIEIAGRDLSALPMDVQETLYRRRLDWIHKFSDTKVEIRIFSIREMRDESEETTPAFSSVQLRSMMGAWSDSFRQAYRNRHYVMLSVGGGEERAREEMRQAVDDTLDLLRDYQPRVLELGEETSGEPSELNSFLAALLNPCMGLRVRPVRGNAITADDGRAVIGQGDLPAALNQRLADHLIASELEFLDGGGAFQVSLTKRRLNGIAVFHGPETVWMGTLGMAGFGDKTSIDMIQHILSLETNLTIVQHVKPIPDIRAEADIQERAKRSVNATLGSLLSTATKELEQFQVALEHLRARGPDHMSLCEHQMTIFVYGKSPEELEAKMRLVERTFQAHAMTAVRELSASEPLWFSQFPPHRIWIRPAKVVSPNIATCVSFESPTSGLDRCDWGNRPVTRFRTLSGAPYSFCWHKDSGLLSTGHTVVFGGTGSGKTTLLNFLAGGTLGYEDAKVFLIDRNDGSYIATRAFGGQYLHLQSDSKELGDEIATMNPLQMDLDRGETMGGPTQWLTQWIRDFLCNLDKSDIQSEEALGRIVRDLAKEPKENRSLGEIYRSLNDSLAVKHALKRWVDGEYKYVLNGARDSLDFSKDRFFGFAFDRILNDGVLARALLPYLSYRIVSDMERQGNPWLLILDEAAALISDERFRAWYFELLQEARKKRGVVVSAFQRVGTLLQYEGLAELVLQQCPTKIVLPNVELEMPEAEVLGLSPTEFSMVRKEHPITRSLDRFMLVKRDGEGSCILHTDFRSLRTDRQNYLNLLMSGRSVADKLRRLERDYQREPGAALQRFVEMSL